MISVTILETELEEEYREYVKLHPYSTIYHTLEWKHIGKKCFSHHPHYLVALDSKNKNKIVGVFPLFLVKNFSGKRLISVPLRDRCGPLYDNEEALRCLLSSAKELCIKKHAAYIEIDTINGLVDSVLEKEGFTKQEKLIRTTTNLKRSRDEIWKIFDKGSVRSSITKAEKEGVMVVFTDEKEDLILFYDLFLKTRKKLGSLAYSYSFFEEIWDKFHSKGEMQLLLAFYKDKCVAGIIVFCYNKIIIDAYAASNEEYLTLRPNNFIIWEIMKWGISHNYDCFDFGADPESVEGLLRFKARFASNQEKIPYYYYLNTAKNIPDIEKVAGKLITKGLQKIPLFMHRKLGHKIIKHIV